jgi:transcriptional regulator GlxA family with amidase domain
MIATARFFLVDAAGREQRFYSTFAPRLHHGDAAVLQTQHWLQLHFAENLKGLEMATQAKLGERTLLRRFRRANRIEAQGVRATLAGWQGARNTGILITVH